MRIALMASCVLIGACAGPIPSPVEISTPASTPPASLAAANRWSEPTRKVLIEHCGQCHLGSLPTAIRRAMAIYDLSEARWDARLTPANFPGITRRVDRQATEAQKAVVDKYLRCARDRACDG